MAYDLTANSVDSSVMHKCYWPHADKKWTDRLSAVAAAVAADWRILTTTDWNNDDWDMCCRRLYSGHMHGCCCSHCYFRPCRLCLTMNG